MDISAAQCLSKHKERSFYCIKCGDILCIDCKKTHNDNCKNPPSRISIINDSLLNQFIFKKYLGQGSYGLVFKVENITDDKDYALKIINDIDDDQFQSAKSEITLMSKIDHPNIIKYCYSSWNKKEGILWVLMELADHSLTNLINEIDQSTAFKYFNHICQGLKCLHFEHKIIHRDLKLGNILIKNDVAKLCDFGEAKLFNLSNNLTLTKTGGFGTPEYLAPEIFKAIESNINKYNEKTDIWALGILFHKILAKNKHPFLNTPHIYIHEIERLDNIKNSFLNPINLDKLIVNEFYITIIKKCLELNPENRPNIIDLINFIEDNNNTKISEVIIEKSNKFIESQKENNIISNSFWKISKKPIEIIDVPNVNSRMTLFTRTNNLKKEIFIAYGIKNNNNLGDIAIYNYSLKKKEKILSAHNQKIFQLSVYENYLYSSSETLKFFDINNDYNLDIEIFNPFDKNRISSVVLFKDLYNELEQNKDEKIIVFSIDNLIAPIYIYNFVLKKEIKTLQNVNEKICWPIIIFNNEKNSKNQLILSFWYSHLSIIDLKSGLDLYKIKIPENDWVSSIKIEIQNNIEVVYYSLKNSGSIFKYEIFYLTNEINYIQKENLLSVIYDMEFLEGDSLIISGTKKFMILNKSNLELIDKSQRFSRYSTLIKIIKFKDLNDIDYLIAILDLEENLIKIFDFKEQKNKKQNFKNKKFKH